MASVSGRLWPWKSVDRGNPDGYAVYPSHDDRSFAGVGDRAVCRGAYGGHCHPCDPPPEKDDYADGDGTRRR